MRPSLAVLAAAVLVASPVRAQQPELLGDLAPLSPKKLSRDDLQQLLPGAEMSRISQRGNTNRWTNDADGTFVISNDKKNASGVSLMAQRGATRPGKWHISDDGRYGVLIEWKNVDTEEWCRYIFQTTGGYYATKSDAMPTEKVYKLEIKK